MVLSADFRARLYTTRLAQSGETNAIDARQLGGAPRVARGGNSGGGETPLGTEGADGAVVTRTRCLSPERRKIFEEGDCFRVRISAAAWLIGVKMPSLSQNEIIRTLLGARARLSAGFFLVLRDAPLGCLKFAQHDGSGIRSGGASRTTWRHGSTQNRHLARPLRGIQPASQDVKKKGRESRPLTPFPSYEKRSAPGFTRLRRNHARRRSHGDRAFGAVPFSVLRIFEKRPQPRLGHHETAINAIAEHNIQDRDGWD